MKTKNNIKKYIKSDLMILAIVGSLMSVPTMVNAQDEDQELRPFQQRILNHFDKNGDGVLNDREAYHARHFYNRWKQSQGNNDRPRDLRRRIDRNNDGRIGPRERANARRIQARRSR